MKITIKNYEAYFLDYSEGHISPEDNTELQAFLSIHPELKNSLENYEPITIEPDKTSFKHRRNLKKLDFSSTINTYNFNDFCIAYHEQLLAENKAEELRNFIAKNPELELHFNQYGKAYLQPATDIRYPNKRILYHKTYSIKLLPVYITTIAASIAIIIMLYQTFNGTKNKSNHPSAAIIAKNNTYHLNNHAPAKGILPVTPAVKKKNNALNRVVMVKTEEAPIAFNNRKDSVPKALVINYKTIENKREFTIVQTAEERLQIEYAFNNNLPQKETDRTSLTEKIRTITNRENRFRKKGKLSMLDVMQAGIWGFNKLTDSNVKLTEKTDSTGNIIALSFESDLLEFHKSKGN